MQPTTSCVECNQNHTNNRAFMLTCRLCKRSWHHVCHRPPLGTDEIIRRLRGSTSGNNEYSIESWVCHRCSKSSAATFASTSVSRSSGNKREPIPKKEEISVPKRPSVTFADHADPGDTSSDSDIVEVKHEDVDVRKYHLKGKEPARSSSTLPRSTDAGESKRDVDLYDEHKPSISMYSDEHRGSQPRRLLSSKSARKTPFKPPSDSEVIELDDSDSDIEVLPGPPASVPPETPIPSRSTSMALTEATLTDDEVDQLIDDDEPIAPVNVSAAPLGQSHIPTDKDRITLGVDSETVPPAFTRSEPLGGSANPSHDPSHQESLPIPSNSYPFAPQWMRKYLQNETDVLLWQRVNQARMKSGHGSTRRKPVARKLNQTSYHLDLVNTH